MGPCLHFCGSAEWELHPQGSRRPLSGLLKPKQWSSPLKPRKHFWWFLNCFWVHCSLILKNCHVHSQIALCSSPIRSLKSENLSSFCPISTPFSPNQQCFLCCGWLDPWVHTNNNHKWLLSHTLGVLFRASFSSVEIWRSWEFPKSLSPEFFSFNNSFFNSSLSSWISLCSQEDKRHSFNILLRSQRSITSLITFHRTLEYSSDKLFATFWHKSLFLHFPTACSFLTSESPAESPFTFLFLAGSSSSSSLYPLLSSKAASTFFSICYSSTPLLIPKSIWPVITKYHRQSGLNKRNKFISHGSRGWDGQDQGFDRFGPRWEPSFWFSMSSHRKEEEPKIYSPESPFLLPSLLSQSFGVGTISFSSSFSVVKSTFCLWQS